MMAQDFYKYMQALVAQNKADGYARTNIKTLGELILMLEAQPGRNTIALDFTDENIEGLHSYRGYYSDLAIDYGAKSPMSVATLLLLCQGAVGSTFEGWKGGDFVMSRHTLMWVAAIGSTGRMLVGIEGGIGKTTILTEEDIM